MHIDKAINELNFTLATTYVSDKYYQELCKSDVFKINPMHKGHGVICSAQDFIDRVDYLLAWSDEVNRSFLVREIEHLVGASAAEMVVNHLIYKKLI